MPLTELRSNILYQAILKGCESVIAEKERLNAINLFPVADADTGDNLASTARAIIHHSSTNDGVNEMIQSVANASALGARGNSGIIFSQFFHGLASVSHDKDPINLIDFSAMLVAAAGFVRSSILSPVEGTILTMIEDFAKKTSILSKDTNCFHTMMAQLLPELTRTLQHTTVRIPVLKKANVVDAGALGFYFFVQGLASVLSHSPVIENIVLPSFLGPIELPHVDDNRLPIHRYCTEITLRADKIDKAHLSSVLNTYGDSLVFAGNHQRCKFHIHTNQPWDVFSIAMDHGTIDHAKVDDMLRQYEVTHHRKHPIALVTDSSADIPQTLRDEHQIHLIPLNIHIGENQLLDSYSFKPDLFYNHLNVLPFYPKTSLPSKDFAEEKLHYLAQHYEKVIVLSISKSMSGTFDLLSQIAKKHPSIHVINTRTNSGAHGLLVQYAAELIHAGLSFERIIKKIDEAIAETSIFVMVNDLDAMIRSGRINQFAGRIGQLSGIKLLVSINKEGKGQYFSTAFTTDAALSKIIATAKKIQSESGKKLIRYCIVHAGAEEKAHDFAKRLTEALQSPPAYIENASPVIGLHAGHGCIALAMLVSDTGVPENNVSNTFWLR